MLSLPTQSDVVHFVLEIPPSTNPYRATADLISELLMPCPLPRWSQYVEHIYGVIYLINLFLAVFIIYTRLKTKKFFLVQFNALGMIQLDRGFHFTTTYAIHSAFAVLDLVYKDLVVAGRVYQTWSNLITGAKSTLLLCISWGFLWICVCHCALVKWGPIGNSNQTSYEMPYNLARISNTYFLTMIIWTIVPVFWSFFHLSMEYISVQILAKKAIRILLHHAGNYLPSTYSPLDLLTLLLPLKEALVGVPRIVHYTRLGSSFYLTNCLALIVTYLPFLALILKNFSQRGVTGVLLRKQGQVLWQGVLHVVMSCLSLSILVYMLHFPGDTFIYDPSYWLALRIGLHGSMALAECLAFYLLWCTMHSSDAVPTRNHVVVLKKAQEKADA